MQLVNLNCWCVSWSLQHDVLSKSCRIVSARTVVDGGGGGGGVEPLECSQHEREMSSIQNPYDIPLYWLVNRDPYIGLL